MDKVSVFKELLFRRDCLKKVRDIILNNNECQKSVCKYLFKVLILIISDKHQDVGLLGQMVVLCLIFGRTSIVFSIVAIHCSIIQNTQKVEIASMPINQLMDKQNGYIHVHGNIIHH